MNSYTFRLGETDDGKPVEMNLEILIGTRLGIIANNGLTLDGLAERSGKSKTSSQFQSTVAMFIKNKIATRHGDRIVLHNPLGARA